MLVMICGDRKEKFVLRFKPVVRHLVWWR